MYIRFVVNELDEDSGRRKGLFQVLIELDDEGVVVETIKSEKPGYVVYEDSYQVAAEPFRETDT